MTNAPDILQKIITQKVVDINNDRLHISENEMIAKATQISTHSQFYHKLHSKIQRKEQAVIAEIKKASPSKGILREDFNPTTIAKNYEEAGAVCLSILTDKTFFKGSDEYLSKVANETTLPILRKEFIIDPYQIYQSKVLGASAILLIATILDTTTMKEFITLANELKMDTLIEVHNKTELDKVLTLDTKMIGINNRDLKDFSVNLETTTTLLPYITDKIVITESGIISRDDVEYMNKHGIYGFLVGETFMRDNNIVSAYQKLFK